MQKRVVIFDMDGTLVDSSMTIAGAINYVRKNLYLPPMEPHKIIEKINDHSINPAFNFYGAKHFDKDHEKWFSEYYTRCHTQELRLYDGIGDMLIALKAKGAKLAVATNAYRNSTIESLTHLGILGLFDAVACYDDVARGKPYPDMLLHILDSIDMHPKEAIFIGDGSRDAMAAKEACIDFWMVNWGFSDHGEALESVDALHHKVLQIFK